MSFSLFLIILTPLSLLAVWYINRRWLNLARGALIFLAVIVFLFVVFLGLAVTETN